MQTLLVHKQPINHRLLTYSAIVAIVAGLLYLLMPVILYPNQYQDTETHNPVSLSVIKQEETATAKLSITSPYEVTVSRLGIQLPVTSGNYDFTTRQWTLDYRHAFYTDMFKTPLIYGHNANEVFGKLSGIQKGDKLSVKNGDGRTLAFEYFEDIVVKPEESPKLDEQRNNTLILMTCTGVWNENRRLLLFTYTGEAQPLGVKDEDSKV